MSLRDTYDLQLQIDALRTRVNCLSCCGDSYSSTFFIDPENGSATNSGLSEANAVVSPSNVNIRNNTRLLLKAGSVFSETFNFEAYTDIYIGRYGGGANPVIDGSEIITGWAADSGIFSVMVANEVAVGRIRLYKNNKPMVRAASLVACQATDNTYFIASDGTASTTPTKVWLNVVDPTEDEYRATIREYCVNLASGTVVDIDTLRAISNNGSTVILREGNIIGGRADYGSKHNAFIGSGIVDGLRAYGSDAPTTTEPANVMLVGYRNVPDGYRIEFKNVEIVNEDNDFHIESAFITHGTSDGFEQVSIIDSKISNISLVFSGDANRCFIENNVFENIGTLFNVDAADELLNVINNTATFSRLSCPRSGVSLVTNLDRNLLYYPAANNSTGNAAFYHTGTNKELNLFRNIIIVEGRKVIDAASTGGIIRAYENILVSTATNEHLLKAPTGVTYRGDYNIFYAEGANEVYNQLGATAYTTLLTWQAASSQDTNSVWLTAEQYRNLWVKTAQGYVVNPNLEVTDANGGILNGEFPDGTKITFNHIFGSAANSTDVDWLETGGTPPTTNASDIYHTGDVFIGDTDFGGATGKLNLVGRLDQRYPTQSLGNVAIGVNTVNPSATGDSNVGIGTNALNDLTNGSNNVGIGADSAPELTTGIQNVLVGGQTALTGNPSASVLIGFQAGRTSSAQNTVAVGYGAAFAGGGNYATIVGQDAGHSTTSGNGNTFIGANAGYSNVSGASNVFIGVNAGYNETGSDKLYIDNSNTANPLLHGNFSTRNLKINGDLQLTTKTPASASATGIAGTIAWDASYIYICTATDTWKRVAIATW